jgi:hypothetical protein
VGTFDLIAELGELQAGPDLQPDFTVPKTTPAGPNSLVVVANGIASQPVPVTIS